MILHENNNPTVGAMSSSPVNSRHGDMSPTNVCFHSRWWQRVMFRLYENKTFLNTKNTKRCFTEGERQWSHDVSGLISVPQISLRSARSARSSQRQIGY